MNAETAYFLIDVVCVTTAFALACCRKDKLLSHHDTTIIDGTLH